MYIHQHICVHSYWILYLKALKCLCIMAVQAFLTPQECFAVCILCLCILAFANIFDCYWPSSKCLFVVIVWAECMYNEKTGLLMPFTIYFLSHVYPLSSWHENFTTILIGMVETIFWHSYFLQHILLHYSRWMWRGWVMVWSSKLWGISLSLSLSHRETYKDKHAMGT